MLLEALDGTDLVAVAAVLDDDVARQDTLCHHVPVVHPAQLGELAVDSVIVTSVAFDTAIQTRLKVSAVAARLPVYSLARVS